MILAAVWLFVEMTIESTYINDVAVGRYTLQVYPATATRCLSRHWLDSYVARRRQRNELCDHKLIVASSTGHQITIF